MPRKKKRATYKESPDDVKPIWAFRSLDEGGPWDFAESGKDLGRILKRLGEWEVLTWHQIITENRKNNHTCKAENLTQRAQARLREIDKGRDPRGLLALHIGGSKVLYGFRDGPAFHILWYDSNHRYGNADCVCEPHHS